MPAASLASRDVATHLTRCALRLLDIPFDPATALNGEAFDRVVESLSEQLSDAAGAELAIKEVSDSGKFMGGSNVTSVQVDNTCTDAAASVAAVERLVTSEKVNGIMGGMCSGETIASLERVAVPNGMVMISPSATSPALTDIQDQGYFFRTSPSDARQGEVMSDIMNERGVKNAAVTYTNNDYGKGLAESFKAAFEKKGGKVTMIAAHDDGKADYSAEVAALAANATIVVGVFAWTGKIADGVFLAGASTHPGGGVIGASGRTVARLVGRRLGRSALRRRGIRAE